MEGGAAEMNIVDYVEGQLDRLETKPFNTVDSLVFSQLAYMYLDECVPGPDPLALPVRIGDLLRAERFPSMFRNVRDPDNNRKLLFALAASPRFRDIRVCNYVDKVDADSEKQFSAITCLLGDGTAYIAIRGTDATFIGWKEDFNMAFISPVPSQEEGVAYVNRAASLIPGKLRVGGHSKGGNIAVYAAMQCERAVQDRIVGIYSHDGPGFMEGILSSEAYRRIRERINKTVPQSSVVGMLLQQQEEFRVVASTRFGIAQHDPFSWEVEGDDFRYADRVSSSAIYMNRTLHQWLGTLDAEQLELFVDTLFRIIGMTNAATIYEFSADWQKRAIALLGAVKHIDPDTRKFLMQTIKALVKSSLMNLSFRRRADEARRTNADSRKPVAVKARKPGGDGHSGSE